MPVTTLPEFNPTGDDRVAKIKTLTEELIKYVEGLEGVDGRCKAVALTNYEQAAMWAVKSCFVKIGE